MYDSTKEYVTKDSYLDFSGIDLDIELKNSHYDNDSQKDTIFIKNVQTWLYQFMTTRYNTEDWELNWDDDTFTTALLWQIKHTLKYGEETGISETAYGVLRQHGMANPKWS